MTNDAPTTPAVRRVLLVSDARSIHTARWANGLAGRGLQVAVASLHDPGTQPYDEAVRVSVLPGDPSSGSLAEYVRSVPALRRLVADFDPDVVNSHYASNNALLADLAVGGRRPHLASVWGADVYDIPLAGPLPRTLVGANLRMATAIASTSRAMAGQTRRWVGSGKQIFLTPFGIDLARFTTRPDRRGDDRPLVVGTVKTLLPKYGVDTLLRAFALVHATRPAMRLDIYGDGPQRGELESLATELGIAASTTFHGQVPHDRVPEVLQGLDIYVALSRLDSESFGVAILEASASGVPVVVSDASGPAEVTEHEVSGLVVPRDNPDAAARAIARLADDPELRARMGRDGRRHVEQAYSWEASLDTMIEAYQGTIALHRRPPVARATGLLASLRHR